MYYLVPNREGLWEHKFVPEEYCKGQDWCLFCKRQQEKSRKKANSTSKYPSNRSSDKSASQGRDAKNNDPERASLNATKEAKVVIHMKDKIIISNKKYVQKKNQRRLNETFNTVSQLQVNSNTKKDKKSGHSGEETPGVYENDLTEINNNALDDNYDKNSQHNFELSQRYDEITEYHELNLVKEPIKSKNTFKMGEDSSPKS